MTQSSTAPRLSPDDRRGHIIGVAARHLSRAGAEALSVRAVAEEAGVTRALVHHYFGGRESLVEAVMQAELGRILAATAPDPARSADENLRSALNAYLDFFSASGGELRTLYLSGTATTGEHAAAIAQNHEVQVARIIQTLGLPDTPVARLGIGSWLAFVVAVAAASVHQTTVPRADIMRLCLRSLDAIAGSLSS